MQEKHVSIPAVPPKSKSKPDNTHNMYTYHPSTKASAENSKGGQMMYKSASDPPAYQKVQSYPYLP